MASFVLTLLALFAVGAQAQNATYPFNFFYGGASSFLPLASRLGANCLVKNSKGLFTYPNCVNSKLRVNGSTFAGGYSSVGSGAGVSGFINGLFAAGLSDDPMTNAQEATAQASSLPTVTGSTRKKYTVPLVIAAYGVFVTTNNADLRMDGVDIYNIFKDGGRAGTGFVKWGTFAYNNGTGGGNAGDLATLNVVPICRNDSSGTTAVFKLFMNTAVSAIKGPTSTFAKTATAFLLQGESQISGSVFNASWAANSRRFQGSDGICGALNKNTTNKGFVGYSQRSTCSRTRAPAAKEIAIRNRAGVYIRSLDNAVQLSQSLPRITFAAGDNWSSFSGVYAPGATTLPMVSVIFMFTRTTYKGLGPNTAAAKAISNMTRSFFNYLIQAVPVLAINEQYEALPSNLNCGTKCSGFEGITAKNIGLVKFE